MNMYDLSRGAGFPRFFFQLSSLFFFRPFALGMVSGVSFGLVWDLFGIGLGLVETLFGVGFGLI